MQSQDLIKTPNKALLIIALLVFSFVAIFGLNLSMPTNEQGEMINCSSVSSSVVCPMNVIEHIVSWQRMFTALPVLVYVFLFLSVMFVLLNFLKNLAAEFLNDDVRKYKRFYFVQNLNSPLFNYLKQAFAQGILNPKIY